MESLTTSGTSAGAAEGRVGAALREAARALEKSRLARTEPLAIVGMACRFPGADSPEDFWRLLTDGRSAVAPLPPADRAAEWPRAAGPKTPGALAFAGGGFLSSVDRFDAGFFEISPREAKALDPQQRLLLEVAWEALEHAGIQPQSTAGSRCGVFTGICASDYLLRLARADLAAIDPYFSTGNAHGTAAGRVSYFLRWQGPALAIDTACSSSLVAVHLAMRSLHDDECDMALAMGVNLMLAPHLGVSLSQAGVLSPTGTSRAFAAGADGFVRGEGCGAVLLKRLSRARRDGDRIIAVLRGSAVNQDGRSNGLTAPNGAAQRGVIEAAMRDAGLEPAAIDYVEAHGTGTDLGDPVEMHALMSVFAPRDRPLRVGSVKTNIGHLEGAAGIAGLIKTCLALQHDVVPRHLHCDRRSERIDWREGFEVPTVAVPWPRRQDRPRRAGVSSFGFGGTNAHVIVEEAPAEAAAADGGIPARGCTWVKLSARAPAALRAQARRLADALEQEPLARASLPEIVRVANAGRSDMACRAAVAAATRDQLVRGLRRVADSAAATGPGVMCGDGRSAPAAVWVFPDLTTTPTDDAARRLAEVFPEFAARWHELSAAPAARGTQVRACAFQIALSALWGDCEAAPLHVRGVGAGRVAAAVAAGLLTEAEGVQLAGLLSGGDASGGRHDALQNFLDGIPVRQPRCDFPAAGGVDATMASRSAAFWAGVPRDPAVAEPPPGSFIVCFGPATAAAPTASPLVPPPGPAGDAVATFWSALAAAYVAGRPVDWRAALGPGPTTVSLPTYPFQRERHWFDVPTLPGPTAPESRGNAPAGTVSRAAESACDAAIPPLGTRLDLATGAVVFESDLRDVPDLWDHRVFGRCTFPAAGFLTLAAEAGAAAAGRPVAVADLRIPRGLTWDRDRGGRLQTIVERPAGGPGDDCTCTIAFRSADSWTTHATCRLVPVDGGAAVPPVSDRTPDPAATTLDGRAHYATCAAAGLDYGGSFRGLRHVAVRGDLAWGEVALPLGGAAGPARHDGRRGLHPALLDGCLQGIVAVLRDERALWLPVAAERFVLHRPEWTDAVRFALRVGAGGSAAERRAEVSLWSESGAMIASLEGLTLQRVDGSAPAAGTVSGAPAAGIPTVTDPDAVTAYVRRRVAAILQCDPAELESDRSLEGLGLDSMMILELLDDLERHLGFRIPMQRFANGITLGEIAAFGVATSDLREPAAVEIPLAGRVEGSL